MAGKKYNILFLCTGNSARSVLAEAIMNHEVGDQFQAYSAGSKPSGNVHPKSIALLQRLGYDTSKLRSKNWNEFDAPDAPQMDFIFTVCDSAAAEECPLWPGHPSSAHWGLPDPAAVTGSDAEISNAFEDTFRTLRHRILNFAQLPFDRLDALALQQELNAIGSDETQAELTG